MRSTIKCITLWNGVTHSSACVRVIHNAHSSQIKELRTIWVRVIYDFEFSTISTRIHLHLFKNSLCYWYSIYLFFVVIISTVVVVFLMNCYWKYFVFCHHRLFFRCPFFFVVLSICFDSELFHSSTRHIVHEKNIYRRDMHAKQYDTIKLQLYNILYLLKFKKKLQKMVFAQTQPKFTTQIACVLQLLQ